MYQMRGESSSRITGSLSEKNIIVIRARYCFRKRSLLPASVTKARFVAVIYTRPRRPLLAGVKHYIGSWRRLRAQVIVFAGFMDEAIGV